MQGHEYNIQHVNAHINAPIYTPMRAPADRYKYISMIMNIDMNTGHEYIYNVCMHSQTHLCTHLHTDTTNKHKICTRLCNCIHTCVHVTCTGLYYCMQTFHYVGDFCL